MNAPTSKRYRFRDYTCHQCKSGEAHSASYCADIVRDALIHRSLSELGSSDAMDAVSSLVWAATAAAAADAGLCSRCLHVQVKQEAGAAVLLLAGRRAA